LKEYSFEKLEVWKTSKEFVKHIYCLTNDFPNREKYGIVNQLRRAVISIPTNLAEGSGRTTGKDKARFTQISYGSLMECLNLIIISNELGLIDNESCQSLRSEIEIISRKLSNLRRVQIQNPKPLNY